MSEPPFLLETATPEDLPALIALERECFSHPWTPQGFRDAMADPSRGAVLVLRAPADQPGPLRGVVGYCAYQVVLDELHIHNLAVLPQERGRGHARLLLLACLKEGVRRGADRALLEVRSGNREALALYRSCGFTTVGVRRGYYAQPADDALLLERRGPLG